MWLQKGSALLISLLISGLIVAFVGLFFFTGSFSSKQTTTNVFKQDIDQAKEAQIQADFRAIQTALEAYRINKGHYPESLKDLVEAGSLPRVSKNPYTGKDYDFSSDGKI